MLHATFDLEVTTPLFLAGADQATAELRPPSFRGAMRYWYRTLAGGLVGGNVNEVRRREAQVFGKAEHGSPISIRISEVLPQPELRTFKRAEDQSGTSYLFWSMGGSKDRPSRQYYPPPTCFKLILTAHEKDQQLLEEAIIALWLLTNLGGLGARSRRCAGSLAIRSSTLTFAPGSDLPALSPGRPQSSDELTHTLTTGLQAIKRFYKIEKLSKPVNKAFDIIAPETCSIWVLSQEAPWESIDEALDTIGTKFKTYRQSLKDPQREALGLPFRERKDRLASPLHLHITALERGYVCVATLFRNRILPLDLFEIIEDFIRKFEVNRTVKL
jgi:CRISPR-associated protein Cmr1